MTSLPPIRKVIGRVVSLCERFLFMRMRMKRIITARFTKRYVAMYDRCGDRRLSFAAQVIRYHHAKYVYSRGGLSVNKGGKKTGE